MTLAILEGVEDSWPDQMQKQLSHTLRAEREVSIYMSFNDTSNEHGGVPDFDIKVEQLPRGQVRITVQEVQEPHWNEKRELEQQGSQYESTYKTVLDVTLQHPCPAERVTDYMQKVEQAEFEERLEQKREEVV
tara:strand:- start:900 stop:1298 length:399 start_codon:yes stop_codon:yes gene_type:complete